MIRFETTMGDFTVELFDKGGAGNGGQFLEVYR